MITKDDLIKYKSFARIIDEAMFDIKGSAVIPTALLVKWYIELGPKLISIIEKEDAKNDVVEAGTIGDPVGDEV